jgi:sugar transferase (PEP-CTERM/EpsH1 system associated)
MGNKSLSSIPVLYLNYSMDIGGIETLICEFATRLNVNGFFSSVCVFNGGGSLEKNLKAEGVKVYRVQKREGIDLTVITRLRRLLKEKGIKILHTHNYTTWLYGVLAAIGINGFKHIHTEHSNIKKKRRGWAERLLIHFTDSIVCVSEDVKRFMIENQGISPEKLAVVYNGVDTDRFRPDSLKSRLCRDELGIKQDAPIIGIVARLTPVKDHITLLKAFFKIYEDIPEAVLLVVGDGELKHTLISQTYEMGLSNNVFFVGERQDIPELLNVMDIFVLSSLSEGHNMSLLEAMAAGLPVVATDVGGNSEIVVDGATGFLVLPENTKIFSDKVMILLRDESLRSHMGKNGRVRVVKNFDKNRMMEEYHSIYSTILGSKLRK